eukprot:COSAG01_NODE_401_length_17529_cov_47.865806_12_plen_163_part_00
MSARYEYSYCTAMHGLAPPSQRSLRAEPRRAPPTGAAELEPGGRAASRRPPPRPPPPPHDRRRRQRRPRSAPSAAAGSEPDPTLVHLGQNFSTVIADTCTRRNSASCVDCDHFCHLPVSGQATVPVTDICALPASADVCGAAVAAMSLPGVTSFTVFPSIQY